jgi:FkbM family methyltransferase
MSMTWARDGRRVLGRLMPEIVKSRLRPRLFGFRAAERRLPLAWSMDAQGPLIVIDGRITLRYRDEDRPDIQYHLSDNGESVDEIASFIELAATAHTLFDVGAWKGLFSLIFCLSADHRRAVAYEPSSAGTAAVVTLADHNQCAARVAVRQAAVGRMSGRTGYHEAPSGIVTIGADGSGLEDAGDLQLVSLDDEVRSLGIVPDLLKIDVEGYEYEVLAGARNLLRDHKPAISLELHLDLLERRGQSSGQIITELQSHGYTFRSCAGRSLSASQICNSTHAVLRFVAVC